jgi:hypothetical protein
MIRRCHWKWKDMEWKPLDLTERTDLDKNGRFYRYKEARFSVGESEHTIKISMPDFDAGRSLAIQQEEANKIVVGLGEKGPAKLAK